MRLNLRARWGVAAMLGWVGSGSAVAAALHALPTGEPFAVESSVIVPFDEATAVSIIGIRGRLSISTGEKRQLNVISRVPGPNGAKSPVGIWLDRSTLIIAPPPGDKGRARGIDVEVPRGVAISVDADYSDVDIQSQGGTVEIHGDNLRATVQAAGGSVVAELLAGTLTVRDSKDAKARLRGTTATISAMSGNVTVRAEGGRLTVTAVDGSTDVESEGSKLAFNELSGSLLVNAQKGEVTLFGIKAGAELTLVGTPLRMKDGTGDITVTSDAPVAFQAMEGSMQFDMRGGSLLGKGNKGDLELRGRNTDVNLESIRGVTSLKGEGLTASVVEVGGELQVEAKLSNVSVDRAGDVVLNVDAGSVTIRHAAGAVKAKVTGAGVHILDGMGPVTLEMDGGDGEVSWATISGEQESTLTNAGGKLTVRFSAASACRVDAKSAYGRIDNELANVTVSENFTSARGAVNSGYHPYVHISASGDIRLENERRTP